MAKEKKKIGLMIDLETYGTTPHCVVRQIAMVPFDWSTQKPLHDDGGKVLYPDTSQQFRDGRESSISTLAWWERVAKYSDKYITEKSKSEGIDCTIAASIVSDYILNLKALYDVYIVARGATTFDWPILNDFIEQYDHPAIPHLFYKILDLRSFTSIFKAITDVELVCKEDTTHNGYDDCMEQINQLGRFANIFDKIL